ncbi:MAG: T9SS type A sorting domain-containing protein [Paludibacteraceae bacterium]|nr:T9SS type A sorting domain-containing protein [Paludibacteraceae bacterium]
MKRLSLITLAALLTVAGLYARTIENVTIDGRDRTYAIYEPTTYNNEVVFLLHGLGETYDDYDATAMQNFANKNKCTVVMPQALSEQDATLLELLDMIKTFQPEMGDLKQALEKSAWGANVYITIDDLCTALGISKTYLEMFVKQYPQFKHFLDEDRIQINKDVNDRNFINNLIIFNRDNAKTKIHIVGCSLGGALAYDLGFNTPENITKIASLSGFVSKGVEVPANYNLPTLVIHSETDEIVPYNGGLYSRPIGELVMDIVLTNGARVPKVSIYNEGQEGKQITIQDWYQAPQVKFYSVEKASHTLIDDMAAIGVNIFDVIQDFLFDTHVAADESNASEFAIYPNPVADELNIQSDTEYDSATITNLAGQTMFFTVSNNKIAVGSLAKGLYIIDLVGENGTVEKAKFIKK